MSFHVSSARTASTRALKTVAVLLAVAAASATAASSSQATAEAVANAAALTAKSAQASTSASGHRRNFAARLRRRHRRHRRLARSSAKTVAAAAEASGTARTATRGSVASALKPMDAWRLEQPLDTFLGNYFVSSVYEDPAVSPTAAGAGTAAALDVALGCPSFLSWPDTVDVVLPDPCGSTGGSWAQNGQSILDWNYGCGVFTSNVALATSYTMANGEAFGSSGVAFTVTGTKIKVRSCVGGVEYTIDEKVYHHPGKVHQASCEKYGSCDGTVYIQYFLYDNTGKLLAKTPYMNLFEGAFQLSTSDGTEVASVERSAGWTPWSTECSADRKYTIRYGPGASSAFVAQNERWPVASLVTAMAVRDGYREANGLTRPAACEVVKGIFFFLLLLGLVFGVCVGLYFVREFVINCLRLMFLSIEQRFCPQRMRLPSKYEM
eukprot:TRINITY_DN30416_c0_g1_i1.p1 TRINITY_DN30416_c0_g1~~TRINITY_DN30416_c0_g1_i1.p1  ORF type:complete len:479 (+),score=100.12 TRINITY_DN30416_c0_g1_i1:128-1438(+)